MRIIIATLALLFSITAWAVNIPSWPAAQGNLKVSNYYTVKVKQGNSSFQTVKTLMTNSQNELIASSENNLFKDRTFNFAPFSFNPAAGAVTIQVIKKNMSGNVTNNAANVELMNADGSKTKISNTTVQFKLNSPKYVAVNFQLDANKKSNNGHEVIKHMLMIFADPINSDLNEPSGSGKVVYSNSTTQNQMRNADILVFRNGYHDVVGRFGLQGIQIRAGAKVWLAPGAVVAGSISGVNNNNEKGFNHAPNVEIYGRGLLYMGEHRNNVNNPNSGPFWRPNDPDYVHSGAMTEAISLEGAKNVKIRGIIVGDLMWHGIVIGENGVIDRVKIWGWHGNNDGMRPGDGSMVKNNFIRPVDDAFYAYAMTAENNVIWPSYNGGVITAGWVGKYNTGGIVLNDTKVIYPEWTARANNNGLVMSQLGDTQECTSITVNGMEVWGDPIAIFNLKPSSRRHESPSWNNQSYNPGVHKVVINNLTIHGKQQEPSLLQSDSAWKVKGVKLHNAKIEGFANRYLTNSDRSNSSLFEGNNLTNNNYFQITSDGDDNGGDNGGSGDVSNGTYYLQAAHSGKYIEVAGFSTQNGGNIQQWGGQNGNQKKWTITHVSGGYYKLINVLSGKAMDVDFGSLDNKANILQWGFSGDDNQLFKFVDQGAGYYNIRNKNSDKCVDVANFSQDDRANVHQWGCSGNSNQEFKLISAN
ncbi:RICIN domain-containing protein [Echinimonas agarilytica]|uniref:RICIN domain-containing protein n=1 Tax=Echinimonas agarilytica TaxID=1215918 RepID=A0AA42B680_9GAMM|nr:RICIN domain-containing protein [Echinimonas agarilytica]MCM2678176.1 RICIN domain-containing protein [Echinimonas agarilytica]